MFSKKFKLFGTMVGLVAVLAMGLAMPGVTQQENPLSRQGVVNAVNEALGAALTAAEGDILDPDNATFISTAFSTELTPSKALIYNLGS